MDNTATVPILDNVDKKFVWHGITTNDLAVLFLTVLSNTPVPIVLIIPAWWRKDPRQDFAHIETWQKSSMAYPTTVESHTNLKLHVCMCRDLHFLFILSPKYYFSFMNSDSTTVPRFHTCNVSVTIVCCMCTHITFVN